MDKKDYKTIDEYVAMFPKDVQIILEKISEIVKDVAPDAEGMISYQMPAYKLQGNSLVHFAAWKDHVGFYPIPSGTDDFNKELLAYTGEKSSLRFPLKDPMPYDLIRRIIQFNKENIGKGGKQNYGRS